MNTRRDADLPADLWDLQEQTPKPLRTGGPGCYSEFPSVEAGPDVSEDPTSFRFLPLPEALVSPSGSGVLVGWRAPALGVSRAL